MENQYDTRHIRLLLRDGVLIATYRKGVKINLSIAKEVVEIRLRFTRGKNVPVLIQSEGQIRMDKEARDFLASAGGTKGLAAMAMLLKDPFDWALGSFFIHLKKPAVPSRIFTRYDSAVRWLRNFVN